jgi:hypothetical protein
MFPRSHLQAMFSTLTPHALHAIVMTLETRDLDMLREIVASTTNPSVLETIYNETTAVLKTIPETSPERYWYLCVLEDITVHPLTPPNTLLHYMVHAGTRSDGWDGEICEAYRNPSFPLSEFLSREDVNSLTPLALLHPDCPAETAAFWVNRPYCNELSRDALALAAVNLLKAVNVSNETKTTLVERINSPVLDMTATIEEETNWGHEDWVKLRGVLTRPDPRPLPLAAVVGVLGTLRTFYADGDTPYPAVARMLIPFLSQRWVQDLPYDTISNLIEQGGNGSSVGVKLLRLAHHETPLSELQRIVRTTTALTSNITTAVLLLNPNVTEGLLKEVQQLDAKVVTMTVELAPWCFPLPIVYATVANLLTNPVVVNPEATLMNVVRNTPGFNYFDFAQQCSEADKGALLGVIMETVTPVPLDVVTLAATHPAATVRTAAALRVTEVTTLHGLLTDPERAVKEAAAYNPLTPTQVAADVLTEINTHPAAWWRVTHPAATAETLTGLPWDTLPWIRELVKVHPNCSLGLKVVTTLL